jgi:hypothetical protein
MGATSGGDAIELASDCVQKKAGLRSCAIGSAMEGVQDSKLSIGGESE